MAVSLNNGDTVWDTALSSPHGRTELDRLVDIDSAVHVVGENVFAAGYQGRTAMLALDSGQIWWFATRCRATAGWRRTMRIST